MKKTLKQCAVNSVQLYIGCECDWENLSFAQLDILLAALKKGEIIDRIRGIRDAIISLESEL